MLNLLNEAGLTSCMWRDKPRDKPIDTVIVE